MAIELKFLSDLKMYGHVMLWDLIILQSTTVLLTTLLYSCAWKELILSYDLIMYCFSTNVQTAAKFLLKMSQNYDVIQWFRFLGQCTPFHNNAVCIGLGQVHAPRTRGHNCKAHMCMM